MIEFGTSGTDAAALTPGEVAGRLAAFIWRSVPDQALLDAADSGALARPDQITQRAETMLSDSRGQAMLDDFVLQWLEISDIQPHLARRHGVHDRAARRDGPARSPSCSRTRSRTARPALASF